MTTSDHGGQTTGTRRGNHGPQSSHSGHMPSLADQNLATVRLTGERRADVPANAASAAPSDPVVPSLVRLDAAIERTSHWLLERQQPDGHWCGELEGDTILESEFILLLAWLGEEQSAVARKAAEYLLRKQLPEGGWALYPGGGLEISASAKAYFALKLTGHDPTSEPLQRACVAIRGAGGADAVNSFTRFYLALLGQIPYDVCPAVPPEVVLLPNWSPINIYRISAWSRTIVVPLSIMWAFRPERAVAPELGIPELFLQAPENWPPLRCPGLDSAGGWFTWERFFRSVDRGFKLAERWRLRPFRQRALRAAETWMVRRFAHSDGLGAIFPPIIWSLIALKCLGYADESAEVRECRRQLDALMIEEQGAVRLQPCKSPVWDTALVLRALAAADGYADRATPAETKLSGETDIHSADRLQTALQRGTQWLLAKEVRCAGDWQTYVRAEPAGWFFEYHNAFYPDVDDTIMVLMALNESATRRRGGTDQAWLQVDAVSAAMLRARQWIVAMQNRDGGWGAFDRDNDREFLCHVPFADHNAMIDPSTPDITGRVLESLAQLGMSRSDSVVERAVRYLRATQEQGGSWYGRWGVNYIYGTWQVIAGLAAVGVPRDDTALVSGAEWLAAHQQPCGAWGESAESYVEPALRGRGPATPSQTAWALLGLMAAGWCDHPAVGRGVQYLLDTQQADGAWREPEFTGTGFPRVFYLRYHLYPIYFPLLALARYGRHRALSLWPSKDERNRRDASD